MGGGWGRRESWGWSGRLVEHKADDGERLVVLVEQAERALHGKTWNGSGVEGLRKRGGGEI